MRKTRNKNNRTHKKIIIIKINKFIELFNQNICEPNKNILYTNVYILHTCWYRIEYRFDILYPDVLVCRVVFVILIISHQHHLNELIYVKSFSDFVVYLQKLLWFENYIQIQTHVHTYTLEIGFHSISAT